MNYAHLDSEPLITPAVAAVPLVRPFRWLILGWRDLWRQPGASLFYGLAIALGGALILYATARLPYLFPAAATGFLLVAPMLATGLYELSRTYEAGPPASLFASAVAWRRNASPMLGFAVLTLLAGTAWQVLSVVIVALFYTGGALAPLDLIFDVLTDPGQLPLFFTYVGAGGVFAALMFAAGVITMPMLLDRRCDLVPAIAASFASVIENPLAMALWAALIMALTMIGFASAFLGLIVVLPWLGHASWHAYRDLVRS